MLNNTDAGWPQKPLSEVVDLNPRLDKSAYRDDLEVSFVPMAAVEAGSGRMEVSQTKDFGTVKKGYTPFRESDVLFAKITPCMENGKMAVVPKLTNGLGFGSTEFHVLRPRPDIEPRYVYHFVSNLSFRREAAHYMSGAVGQKRVPTSFLEDALIPVPPFGQQKLIVAEIEKQFSRLDEAVANLKRVKANLKRYKASVLKAAVEGKLTQDWRKQHPDVEPASKLLERILAERRAAWEQAELDKMKLKGRVAINDQWKNRYKTPMKLDEDDYETTPSSWVQVSLDSIASLITDGKHGDCSDEPGSGYYFLSAKDVHGGQLHYSEARQIDKDEFMEVHYRTNLELNDVLITNAGTIGRVAVAKDRYKLPFTTFQKSVAIIKPTKASVSSVFLAYYLEANVAKMQAKSAGTAVKNLLLSTLKAARFCLPSRDEQLEIVAEVERRLSVIDELEVTVKANLTRANRLRQSILKRAFEGKLIKTEPPQRSDFPHELSLAAESSSSYGGTR